MNQRVADILNYLDESQPQQTSSEQTQSSSTEQTQPQTQPQTPIQTQSSNDSEDLNAFNDDKMYNKLSRQLKKKKFPMIFEGRVFNNEGEAQMFKQQVLASRRAFKQDLKQKKIQNSQMNFDAMPSLNSDSDDFEDLIEQDGYIYKKSKSPYAIVKDGKKKLIPKTSKTDTKRIYKSIESTSGKEGIKHLVKAESDEDFRTRSDEAINKVNDDNIKNSYYNHTHNDFADDRTWNQASFLKLMYSMMKENEELKAANTRQQQQRQQANVAQQLNNPMRINPLLLKK